MNSTLARRASAIALGVSLAGGGAVALANTSDAAPGTIHTASAKLTVRSGPSTGSHAVGSLKKGAKVNISCQTYGSRVNGTYGSSTVWDRIGSGRYVSDAYVYTGSDGFVAPRCGSSTPPSSNTGRTWGATTKYNNGSPGQCTWGAYNKFKAYAGGTYPNVHGNAKDVAASARSAGWTVTYTPAAHSMVVFGAGVQGANRTYGHIAWVDSVSKTSTGTYIHITEMNWKGAYVYNTRTVKDVSGMSYILAPHQ